MEIARVKSKAAFHAPDHIAVLAGKRVAVLGETVKRCLSPDMVTFMVGIVPLDMDDIPDRPIMVHPRYLEAMEGSTAAEFLKTLESQTLDMPSVKTH